LSDARGMKREAEGREERKKGKSGIGEKGNEREEKKGWLLERSGAKK